MEGGGEKNKKSETYIFHHACDEGPPASAPQRLQHLGSTRGLSLVKSCLSWDGGNFSCSSGFVGQLLHVSETSDRGALPVRLGPTRCAARLEEDLSPVPLAREQFRRTHPQSI